MVMFVTFSILLLVFVSIERLLPVRRSHTFSRNSKRAKRHTLVFLELAVLFTVTCRLAKRNTYIVFEVIAKTSLLAVSVLIMVTCCMFIGMTLLKMTMVSCNKIAENNLMELSNQNCNLSKSSPAQEIVSKISGKGTKNDNYCVFAIRFHSSLRGVFAAAVATQCWRLCLQGHRTSTCLQFSRQPVHIPRGESNVLGRRATVSPPGYGLNCLRVTLECICLHMFVNV